MAMTSMRINSQRHRLTASINAGCGVEVPALLQSRRAAYPPANVEDLDEAECAPLEDKRW